MMSSAYHSQMKSGPTLTCLQASIRTTKVWMSGTTLYKPKSIWPGTPLRLQRSCIITSFGSSCDMKIFSRKINEGSVDLEKFPASNVCQLAKSSKATARYIRQVVGDPQAAQINLMCHQHTQLSTGKTRRKKQGFKPKQSHHNNAEESAKTRTLQVKETKGPSVKSRCHSISGQSEESSSDELFCLQLKIQ